MLTSRAPQNENIRLVVDQFWCVSDPPADGYETRLPSGRVQLIFSLSDIPLLEVDPDNPHGELLQMFQGPTTRPRRISRKPQLSACGISFRPGGAGALFGPIDDTADRVFDLAHFWGDDSVQLRIALQHLDTHCARLDRLEREIARRINDMSVVRMIAYGLECLRAGMAIKDVCGELGLTQHAFRMLFLKNVGLTPKRYLKIERFRTAITGLMSSASLADLAFDARYSDQSHMTREIKHFAAMTPARLRASERPYVGHVRDLQR